MSVWPRLDPRSAERAPWPLAERFDDAPEAEWGPTEVLAHVAEMIPFWQGEIERIIAGAATQARPRGGGLREPVPFGRVATDGVRLAILERDRSLPPAELYDRIAWSLERLDRRWSTLTPGERSLRGLHPTAGRDDRRGDRRPVHRRRTSPTTPSSSRASWAIGPMES